MLLRYSQLTHNIQKNKCYKIKLYLHQKIYVFIQKLVEFSLIVFMSGKHNLQFEILFSDRSSSVGLGFLNPMSQLAQAICHSFCLQ